MPVLLDLNNPVFLRQWFAMEKDDRLAVLSSCEKLIGMNWNDLYRDRGLRWELIQSRTGPDHQRLYSIRVTQKIRAVVKRSGDFLEFLSLHPNHDSAYQ